MNPVVYRYFDADGVLLYIGSTGNFEQRVASHRSSASWLPFAVRHEIVEYPTLADARRAERFAIATEEPLHNVQCNPGALPAEVMPRFQTVIVREETVPAKYDATAQYLPISAAARHFSVSEKTLRRGIRNGSIPEACFVRWGDAIRIDRHALEQHLAATRRVVTDDTAA